MLSVILAEVAQKVQPGITTADLDAAARAAMKREKVTPAFLGYHGYPAALCTSRNEKVVHGIPSKDELLVEGDLVSLDIGIQHGGLFTDMAVTVPVGTVAPKAAELLAAARTALEKAIAFLRPGITTGDLGMMLQASIEEKGFGVIRDLVGHGVGRKLHEDPMIPNFGSAGKGVRFDEGMVVAIEPMITAGDWHVKTLEDGWTVVTLDGSLAAHFEHTLLVTATGAEILTAA